MSDDREQAEDSTVLMIAQSEARHAKVRQGLEDMVRGLHEQLAKAQVENARLTKQLDHFLSEASPTGHAIVERECAHMALDDRGVPREGPKGALSLVGRIEAYADRRRKAEAGQP